MPHFPAEPGAPKAFLDARTSAGQDTGGPKKPEDWSWPLALMAHYYPEVSLNEIGEDEMNGYLQHVGAIARMQAVAIAQMLAGNK